MLSLAGLRFVTLPFACTHVSVTSHLFLWSLFLCHHVIPERALSLCAYYPWWMAAHCHTIFRKQVHQNNNGGTSRNLHEPPGAYRSEMRLQRLARPPFSVCPGRQTWHMWPNVVMVGAAPQTPVIHRIWMWPNRERPMIYVVCARESVACIFEGLWDVCWFWSTCAFFRVLHPSRVTSMR